MAPEYGKPIHQLPLVPATVLKKHCVHAPLDTRVRSAARLLQALWREDRDLPIGSYVNEDGKRRKTRQPYLRSGGPGRRQFPHIQNRPYRPARAAYREVGVLVDAEQFATNLLSSMPLAFNLLAPWGHSLERASTYPIELLPAFTGSAQEGLQQPVSKVMPCLPVRDRVLSLTCAGGAAPDSSRNLCFL